MKKQQKNSAHALPFELLSSRSDVDLGDSTGLYTPAAWAGPQPDRPAPDVWRWLSCVAGRRPESATIRSANVRRRRDSSQRHPFPLAGGQIQQSPFTEQLMQRVLAPIPNMPSPILTFAG